MSEAELVLNIFLFLREFEAQCSQNCSCKKRVYSSKLFLHIIICLRMKSRQGCMKLVSHPNVSYKVAVGGWRGKWVFSLVPFVIGILSVKAQMDLFPKRGTIYRRKSTLAKYLNLQGTIL